MRIATTTLVACLLLAGSASADIVLGPYSLADNAFADAVVQSAGPALPSGGSDDFLNIVNAPITLADALTGSSNVNTGIANALPTQAFDLAFTDNVVSNQPGPDLVLFDARFSQNSYNVSVSVGGSFGTPVFYAGAVALDTGEDRSFYYKNTGPYVGNVMAIEIDLTAHGLAPNDVIDAVRIQGVSAECDPLGLASLLPGPVSVEAASWGEIKGLYRD